MILIGQYDSPFVRRVAVALQLYGIAYEHKPWSTFRDADQIAVYNPLTRVPTLVLDDGEVLIESPAILDYLDEQVGPDRALIAESGWQRRQALKICGWATGLADKSVILVYERVMHPKTMSAAWTERCTTQIAAALDLLEQDLSVRGSPFWFGDKIGHADIIVACAVRFAGEAHPSLMSAARRPLLAAHSARSEALEAFQLTQQVFIPPS